MLLLLIIRDSLGKGSNSCWAALGSCFARVVALAFGAVGAGFGRSFGAILHRMQVFPIVARLLLLVPLALSLLACSPNLSTRDARAAQLPVTAGVWAGPLKQLFNDGVHPKALAPVEETTDAAGDPLIPYRTKAAELVARVRVRTLTERRAGERVSYRLVLQVGKPLRPAQWRPAQVELQVEKGEAGFGVLRRHRHALRGRTFVGFFRRFRSADGGSELHWYLTADTAEVAGAVAGLAVYKETMR